MASRPTRQWWITYPVQKRGPEFRAQDSGNGRRGCRLIPFKEYLPVAQLPAIAWERKEIM